MLCVKHFSKCHTRILIVTRKGLNILMCFYILHFSLLLHTGISALCRTAFASVLFPRLVNHKIDRNEQCFKLVRIPIWILESYIINL